MPQKKPTDPPEDQEILLAENRDMEDELEEDVGGTPRKVTMKEYRDAEQAFENLVSQEKVRPEKTPFRPGKDTIFVLTENQESALQDCVDSLDKYFKHETRNVFNSSWYDPVNEDLEKLHNAIKKILKEGLDGLSAEERQTVNDFNRIMNATSRDNDFKVYGHLYNVEGPAGFKARDIRYGLDMLGTMIGIPPSYTGCRADELLTERVSRRVRKLERIDLNSPEEKSAAVEAAKDAGLEDLQKRFENTEIGKNLGLIRRVVDTLGDNYLGSYNFENILKEADGLGAFLTARGQNGKSNYDIIVDAILKGNPTNGKLSKQEREAALLQKKAFDMLLGQLNTVCELDIGIPYAIEAKAEYDWNKAQQKDVNAERIKGLNDKLFGKNTTVHWYDDQFQDSLKTLAARLRDTFSAVPNKSENYVNLRNAAIGFDYIRETVRNNSGFNKLSVDNNTYIAVLDFSEILQRKQNGKTLYDLLAKSYEAKGPGKNALDDTLKELNEKLGLEIEIQGAQIGGEKEKPARVQQFAPYTRKIDELQRASNRMDDPKHLKHTLAAVLALRRMSVDPAHREHTKIRTKAAFAKTKALMETKAFKALTDGKSIDWLAKKIHCPENFDKEFTEKLKELDLAAYEKRLENEELRKKLANRASKLSGELTRTGTGVYLLGVKRGCNSGMYDRAVLAMQLAAKKTDAATVMRSVQVVKEYLSNKMTQRSSPSGKTRWKSCMEFLHDAMPEEEFKEYCKEINAARKAKEGSSKYVSPESFGPQKERSKSMSAASGGKQALKNLTDTEPEIRKETTGEGQGISLSGF